MISLFWFSVWKLLNGGGFWYWVLAGITLMLGTGGLGDPNYVRPGEINPMYTFTEISIILFVICFLIWGYESGR